MPLLWNQSITIPEFLKKGKSMSESSTQEVFTLELPVSGEVAAQDAANNAWKIAGRIYKLAQTKLGELVTSKLPERDDVLLAAEDAYDKYVKIVEDIAKDAFLGSVGALYDSIAAAVKK